MRIQVGQSSLSDDAQGGFFDLTGEIVTAEYLFDPSECDVYPDCASREVWKRLSDTLARLLDSFTIADLIGRRIGRNSIGMDYIIGGGLVSKKLLGGIT